MTGITQQDLSPGPSVLPVIPASARIETSIETISEHHTPAHTIHRIVITGLHLIYIHLTLQYSFIMMNIAYAVMGAHAAISPLAVKASRTWIARCE